MRKPPLQPYPRSPAPAATCSPASAPQVCLPGKVGASVSSTIRRFSAMLRCRKGATETSLSLGMTALCWEVSISSPSGHLSEVSTPRACLSLTEMSRRSQPDAHALPRRIPAIQPRIRGSVSVSLDLTVSGSPPVPGSSTRSHYLSCQRQSRRSNTFAPLARSHRNRRLRHQGPS
jgi:hypothetical protein